jgi:hypothetical protein
VLKKVAASCGAATAFFSAALGTRRAKTAGAVSLVRFFSVKEMNENSYFPQPLRLY